MIYVCFLSHQCYLTKEWHFVDTWEPWGIPDPYKEVENYKIVSDIWSTWLCRNTEKWPQNTALKLFNEITEDDKIYFFYYSNKVEEKYQYRKWKSKNYLIKFPKSCTWILEIKKIFENHSIANNSLKWYRLTNIIDPKDKKYWKYFYFPYVFWRWKFELSPKSWFNLKLTTTEIIKLILKFNKTKKDLLIFESKRTLFKLYLKESDVYMAQKCWIWWKFNDLKEFELFIKSLK